MLTANHIHVAVTHSLCLLECSNSLCYQILNVRFCVEYWSRIIEIESRRRRRRGERIEGGRVRANAPGKNAKHQDGSKTRYSRVEPENPSWKPYVHRNWSCASVAVQVAMPSRLMIVSSPRGNGEQWDGVVPSQSPARLSVSYFVDWLKNLLSSCTLR